MKMALVVYIVIYNVYTVNYSSYTVNYKKYSQIIRENKSNEYPIGCRARINTM